MVSSKKRELAHASRSEKWRQWVLALGGLAGVGALISALSFAFAPNDQSQSGAHATHGGTVNQTQQTNGSGQQASQQSGIINQGNITGNPVFTTGNVTVIGGASKPREHAPPPFKLDKYVNVRAARVAGATNVAVAVHRGAGPNSAPLENALREALDKRGFSVIPFFREAFKNEGLAEKLYNGDPELAAQLALRRHCDSVLLGVLRFSGPAENVGNNFYIREAILDIHAIDPGTGQVVNSLVIREKGGGSTAEQSSANAMVRLEAEVAASLSEWSWI